MRASSVINTASKHLHNDLARAIKALEQKKKLEDKKSHPILERMLRTVQGDAAKQEATSSKERPYSTGDMDDNQYQ